MNLEILETERLILRKISPEDFVYLFKNYSEIEIKNILGYENHDDFLKEKGKFEKGYTTHNRSFQYFQIIDKNSLKIIGGCGFHNWYLDHRRAELGYVITNENFKRVGIMSETLKIIIDYGFKIMKLNRIEALVSPENIASLKLMKKFNFCKEGILKSHYFTNNNFEDSIIFSKLITDYEELHKHYTWDIIKL